MDVVEQARNYLQNQIKEGEFNLPPGTSYKFSGSYENQVRAAKTLSIVLPLSLFIIFLILYLQFRNISTPLLVFSGILIAWSGGFMLIWLYGQDWFLNFSVAGTSMRDLFQVHPINLSVAVWVGFIALFGIALTDAVVLVSRFEKLKEEGKAIMDLVVSGCRSKFRPVIMTTVTTALGLFPLIIATGTGSEVQRPLAIVVVFGLATSTIVTLFVVPAVYIWLERRRKT